MYWYNNMDSKNSHKIKDRKKPNDVFITPQELAKKHIDIVSSFRTKGEWYDPFRNSGSYYEQFPTDNKVWSEILYGRDFFEHKEKTTIICSNPPYSCIDKVLEHSVSLNPYIISYLLGVNNITTKRIEFMEKNGYYIKNMFMTKVFKWYGMSFLITWVKGNNEDNATQKGIINYDRKVWR